MSILFVLLMFLLILTISYFRGRKELPAAVATKPAKFAGPMVATRRELGFEVPDGYAFHPGHTWAKNEGHENARVGVDGFTANLLGKVDNLEVIGLNRWVRQGQKLISLKGNGVSLEMLSPVEGVVVAVNQDVVSDPSLISKQPYGEGWICTVKSPEMAINWKNLVQGVMVAPWMQNNLARLNSLTAKLNPALAQDGGTPVSGLLSRMTPELRSEVTKEFFLS